MKFISKFFFFVFSFSMSSALLYLLAKTGLIEKFKQFNLRVFIEYIFIGFFVLYSFPLLETIISKKHKGFVLGLLKQKEFPLCARLIPLKIKRQFFLGVLVDKKIRVLSIMDKNKSFQKGDPFLYYFVKYSSKEKKIKLFERKAIYFQTTIVLVLLLLAVAVRFSGYVLFE